MNEIMIIGLLVVACVIGYIKKKEERRRLILFSVSVGDGGHSLVSDTIIQSNGNVILYGNYNEIVMRMSN